MDRVLDTSEAVKNINIISKYQNQHLKDYLQGKRRAKDDIIVFGDPILSRKLKRPLLFDKNLVRKLSLSIPFKGGFTDAQCIAFSTRQWRELSENDVKILLEEIRLNESRCISPNNIFSTDEVTEIIEKDIENLLEADPKILGESLKLIKRQYATPVGCIDMMFEDGAGKVIVVELKLGKIGRDAVNQLRRYMNYIEKETRKRVNGILVCKGFMPAFEDELKNLKKIKIFRYGWKLEIIPV